MRNFCIFCGNRLVGGACACAEYKAYYGAPAPHTAPAAPAAPTAPAAPAPHTAPSTKAMDSHFTSAGDL